MKQRAKQMQGQCLVGGPASNRDRLTLPLDRAIGGRLMRGR